MKSLLRRLREFMFAEHTRDVLRDLIVFVGVPAMLILVAILMAVVGSWVSEAKEREEARNERTQQAVEAIVEEIRLPEGDEERDSREDTFRRIRELCEVHPGCEP